MGGHLSTARRAIGTICGILASVVLWHIIVSALVWNSTGYRNDPDLGRVYQPGIYVHGVEGFSWSRINSTGMRGPEIAPKEPGASRILFLGDSFTEAFQVPAARAFPERTSELLSQRGHDVEAVNAGRSGASPATYLYLGDWFAEHIQPDAVVVQLGEGDLGAELLDPSANFYLEESPAGYTARFNEGFRSATPLVQRLSIPEWLLEWPLARVAGDNMGKVLASTELPDPFAASRKAAEQPARSDAPAEAPQGDAELADWVVRNLAATYRDPIIVFLPTVDYERDPNMQGPTERAVAEAAQRHGVRFIDVRDDIAELYAERRVAAHGFPNSEIPDSGGHLNAAGHEIVAERLAQVLERELAR